MTVHHFRSSRDGGRRQHYLGLSSAAPESVRFKLKDYVDLDQIQVPARFGHVTNRIAWQTLGNTVAGDCVVAGAAHEHMLWTRAGQKQMCEFTEHGVLDVYKRASGWNGVPNDPSDTGLDMDEFAKLRRHQGLTDAAGVVHKVDAYARIESFDHLMKACYVFGAVGTGIEFPASAAEQFDKHIPWDRVPNSRIDGGHYVPIVGRNSKNYLMCVTWGDLQALSRDFWEKYVMLSIAYLSMDYINNLTKLSPEQFDLTKLQGDLNKLAA